MQIKYAYCLTNIRLFCVSGLEVRDCHKSSANLRSTRGRQHCSHRARTRLGWRERRERARTRGEGGGGGVRGRGERGQPTCHIQKMPYSRFRHPLQRRGGTYSARLSSLSSERSHFYARPCTCRRRWCSKIRLAALHTVSRSRCDPARARAHTRIQGIHTRSHTPGGGTVSGGESSHESSAPRETNASTRTRARCVGRRYTYKVGTINCPEPR